MSCHNTYENHPNNHLKSHWYEQSYEECKSAVIEVAKRLEMSVSNINDEYKEIFLVKKNYKLMVKITDFAYHETCIDLYLETPGFLGRFRWRSFIDRYYAELKTLLYFKGVGLHKERSI